MPNSWAGEQSASRLYGERSQTAPHWPAIMEGPIHLFCCHACLLYIGLVVLHLPANSGKRTPFPLSQFQALRDFYLVSTEGGNFAHKNCFLNWQVNNSSSNPCTESWSNLKCNEGKNSITSLDVQNCDLSAGYLPISLGALKDIEAFNIQSGFNSTKRFMGTIPEAYYLGWPKLKFLNLAGNPLTGTLSPLICKLTSLSLLLIEFTQMSGPVPWECFSRLNFTNMENRGGIFLALNQFSGTISPLLGALSKLQVLDLGSNRFSGSIPSELGGMTALEYLSLPNNRMTGTVPWQLGRASSLMALNLRGNLLHGTGPIAEWPAGELGLFPSLAAIECSYNHFTGPLNPQIGQLTNLMSLIMQSTCLSGTLPQTLCDLSALRTLLLVGLSDNTACQDSSYNWMRPLASDGKLSTVPRSLMQGGVPSCLFALPSIETIFISGNGFLDHLDIPVLSPSLKSLTLSRNRLSGPLPPILQHANLSVLDLGGNKLTGSWSQNFIVPRDKLDLSDNRFSGDIPDSFYSTQCPTFSVLNGNLLNCRGGSAKPPQDPQSHSYACGDSELSTAMYLWLCCFCVVSGLAAAAFIVVRMHYFHIPEAAQGLLTEMNSWQHASTSYEIQVLLTRAKALNLKAFLVVMQKIRTGIFATIFCVLLILLPFFPLLKSINPELATYQQQQSWIVSAAYMRGQLTCFAMWPFILLFVTILGFFVLQARDNFTVAGFFYDNCFPSMLKPSGPETSFEPASASHLRRWTQLMAQVFILTADLVLIFLVNFAYVEQYHSTSISSEEKNFLQLAIAVFRVFWASVVLPTLLRISGFNKKTTAKLRVMLDALNTVILPGVSNLISSRSCFFNLLHPVVLSDIVDVTLYGTNRVSYNFEIKVPFVYSDSCGTSVVTNFVPILIYSCVIDGFLRPILTLALGYFPGLVMRMPQWLRQMLLDGIFWVHLVPEEDDASSALAATTAATTASITTVGASAHGAKGNPGIELLNAPSIVGEQVQNMLLLMTYGFSSPILAFAIALAVTTQTLIWQAVLGRHLLHLVTSAHKDEARMLTGLAELDKSIGGSWQAPHELFWALVWFAYIFWALLFHDFVADAWRDKGSGSSLIISLVVAFVSPVGVFVCIILLHLSRPYRKQAEDRASRFCFSSALRPLSKRMSASHLSFSSGGVGVGRLSPNAVLNPLDGQSSDCDPIPAPWPISEEQENRAL